MRCTAADADDPADGATLVRHSTSAKPLTSAVHVMQSWRCNEELPDDLLSAVTSAQ